MIIILVKQILQMFLLAGIGFLLFKGGKITLEGSKTLGNILIFGSLPAVIINGFRIERTAEHVSGLLWAALAALIVVMLSILISHFVFRKDGVAAFATSFANPGFFGIPLIVASLGQGAVFYAAPFIAFLNIGQWTYGVSRLNGQPVLQGFQPKKLIKAPFVIAILVGIFLFVTQIRLPEILSSCLSSVAGLNTPLAMFTVGVYLAQTDLKKMLGRRSLYLISALRLIVIPALSLLILMLFPVSMEQMRTVLLIVAACPVGSNVAVYAQLHNKDYPYAVETVVISTLLSIVTIPFILYLSSLIW
ncbi:MAG: AEC family transporter [Firmicutes bacterium]|nr:AEC family transporter [Bacillota bacterium]MBR0210622.1 AEC family transporter [Bacillota bacterium]